MKLQEYIPLATRTESSRTKVPEWRCLHASIGLCTEAAELLFTTGPLNTKEELGDALWYVAIAFNAIGNNGPIAPKLRDGTADSLTRDLIRAAGEALDKMKKLYFYNREFDGTARSLFLLDIVEVYSTVCALCSVHGLMVEDVMEANIRKLQKRYPEKFTTEAALNRDLQAEEAALRN